MFTSFLFPLNPLSPLSCCCSLLTAARSLHQRQPPTVPLPPPSHPGKFYPTSRHHHHCHSLPHTLFILAEHCPLSMLCFSLERGGEHRCFDLVFIPGYN